jgi:hypothetical protein
MTCPLLKSTCWREWSLGLELEEGMVECGLQFPPLDWESCPRENPLEEWHERDHGGHCYAILHETALDEISGLDWMTTCIVQLTELHRQQRLAQGGHSLDDERRVRRLALCLLHWTVQYASSLLGLHLSLPSPSPLLLKRSSATLSLSSEVKLNIYRAILATDLFPDYLLEAPLSVSYWVTNLSRYLDQCLSVLAREVLGTCHEVLLIYRTSVPTSRLLSDPTALDELLPVLAMTSQVVGVMVSRIRCFLAEEWEHERIAGEIRSWVAPSWEWIFSDLLSLRRAIVMDQLPYSLHRTEVELIALSEIIADFTALVRHFNSEPRVEGVLLSPTSEQEALVN